MEDLNNHCVAFCKEFHVEVLKSSRKVRCGVSMLLIVSLIEKFNTSAASGIACVLLIA